MNKPRSFKGAQQVFQEGLVGRTVNGQSLALLLFQKSYLEILTKSADAPVGFSALGFQPARCQGIETASVLSVLGGG